MNTAENSDEPSILDSIIKGLPLFTGYLIFLGLLNSLAYYSFFRIDVLRYISLSEAILLSLSGNIVIGVSLASGFLFGRYVATIKIIDNYHKTGLVNETKPNYFGGYIVLAISEIGFLAISIVCNTRTLWYSFIIISLSLVFFALSIRILTPRLNGDLILKRNQIASALITLILTVGTCVKSAIDSIDTKYGKSPMHSIITLKDNKIIKTTDSLVYVGKVEKYTFLYNKKLEGAEIISNDNILDIKFVNR